MLFLPRGLGFLRRLRAVSLVKGPSWIRGLSPTQRGRLSVNLRRILESKKAIDAQIRRAR